MYSFKAGRQGILVTEDGATHAFQLTKDSSYFSDDVVKDPIRLHNDTHQGFYKAPTTQFEIAAERLAKLGYSVFEAPGRKSSARYGFAVVITENDSEMD
jgi:hypothetical protein